MAGRGERRGGGGEVFDFPHDATPLFPDSATLPSLPRPFWNMRKKERDLDNNTQQEETHIFTTDHYIRPNFETSTTSYSDIHQTAALFQYPHDVLPWLFQDVPKLEGLCEEFVQRFKLSVCAHFTVTSFCM